MHGRAINHRAGDRIPWWPQCRRRACADDLQRGFQLEAGWAVPPKNLFDHSKRPRGARTFGPSLTVEDDREMKTGAAQSVGCRGAGIALGRYSPSGEIVDGVVSCVQHTKRKRRSKRKSSDVYGAGPTLMSVSRNFIESLKPYGRRTPRPVSRRQRRQAREQLRGGYPVSLILLSLWC